MHDDRMMIFEVHEFGWLDFVVFLLPTGVSDGALALLERAWTIDAPNRKSVDSRI